MVSEEDFAFTSEGLVFVGSLFVGEDVGGRLCRNRYLSPHISTTWMR